MITDKEIVLISGIEWDSLWQGSQEIAWRLAKAGNRVLYIENPGIRSPLWEDKRRIALRIRNWVGSLFSRGVRQVGPNLYICTPIILPPFGRRWQRYVNRQLLLPLISRAARSLGMSDPVIWTFLPTDTVLDLVNLLNAGSNSTIIYHCTADFSELTPHASKLQASERALLELSDLVFVTCRQLAEHCSPWNDKVHIFPNGVSFELFASEVTSNSIGHHHGDGNEFALPHLSSIPRPIIGYIGGLHRFVDFKLLTEMVRMRPQWSWVFVGPIQSSVGELDRFPNVHLLGQKPHRELRKYLRAFDVCIVPYLKNPATATVVPTKVNEYLAAGKPVVSTELLTICDFNDQHRALLTAPSRPDDFLRAIDDSLRLPNDRETVAHRTRIAKLNDWQDRLDSMSALIEGEMRAKNSLNYRFESITTKII